MTCKAEKENETLSHERMKPVWTNLLIQNNNECDRLHFFLEGQTKHSEPPI